MKFDQPGLIVTLHPETQRDASPTPVELLLDVLDSVRLPIVFTSPNSDGGGRAILDQIKAWVSVHENSRLVASLGTERYYSLLSNSAAMVGNSSSGIVEAASFELPVVNIGTRQKG